MTANAVARTCDMIERTLGKSAAFRKVDERLYVVKQGSAYVTVSVLPSQKKPDRPLVRVYAQVVSGVRPDGALFRQLLAVNARVRFGAFAYVPDGDVILFVHTILGGEHIDSTELIATVSDVALIADNYDDQIVAQYGGRRMQDLVQESAISHMLGDEEESVEEHAKAWDKVKGS
jgi:hypothetical protein